MSRRFVLSECRSVLNRACVSFHSYVSDIWFLSGCGHLRSVSLQIDGEDDTICYETPRKNISPISGNAGVIVALSRIVAPGNQCHPIATLALPGVVRFDT